MFLVRIADRQVLTMGSMAYIEREVQGLRPDIAVVGAGRGRRGFYKYTPRLLRALGNPPVVLPTHWDNFTLPYGYPQPPRTKSNLDEFVEEVRAASPETNVVIPEHLVSVSLGSDGVITRERLKPRVEDWDLIPTIPSGSGRLSHFDRGELDASVGMGWMIYADSIWGTGGESVSRIEVAAEGAEGTAGSLLVTGEVADAPNSYAGAVFFPGERSWSPVDLSDYANLAFWAKGDGQSYQIRVFALGLDGADATVNFDAPREWRHYEIPLSSFGEISDAVTAILFLAGDNGGPFWFQIDELRVR